MKTKIMQALVPILVIIIIAGLFVAVALYGDSNDKQAEETAYKVNLIETLKAEDYDKVEIWLTDRCCLLDEQEEIKEFINLLQAKKMSKCEFREDVDGFVFSITFFKDEKSEVEMVIGGGANVNVYGEIDGESVGQHYELEYETDEEKYQDMYDFYDSHVEPLE